jgi:hypothetical protein
MSAGARQGWNATVFMFVFVFVFVVLAAVFGRIGIVQKGQGSRNCGTFRVIEQLKGGREKSS